MQPVRFLRFLACSTLALLLYSGAAAADCVKPEWKDPATFQGRPRDARDVLAFAFVNGIHGYIRCQRSSLERRASGLPPAAVRELVLRDRAAEDRALAEAQQIFRCMSAAGDSSLDAVALRTRCRTYIGWAEDARRPDEYSYPEIRSEQRTEHGGVVSIRTLDFGRPGQCNHVECSKVIGVEVTNLTPLVLRCAVSLTLWNAQDGTHQAGKRSRCIPATLFRRPASPANASRNASSPKWIAPPRGRCHRT